MSKLIFFIFNIFIILILFIHNLGFFGRYKEGNFCGERFRHLYSSIYFFKNTSISNQIDLKDFIVKKINIYTFKNDFIKLVKKIQCKLIVQT